MVKDINFFESSLDKLHNWLVTQNWNGHDPFDGLNSRITPDFVKKYKRPRQFIIQVNKRSPINMRLIFGVQKTNISKADALFIQGLLKIYKIYNDEKIFEIIEFLTERIIDKAIIDNDKYAWGYEFDVQTRWGYYPAGKPNIIATSFVGNALLDLYQYLNIERYLSICKKIRIFLIKELLYSEDNKRYLTYIKGNNKLIHNASLIGAKYLSRLDRLTDNISDSNLIEDIAKASLNYQNDNGSWFYGVDSNLHWIDGFHTLYVLDGLLEINKDLSLNEIDEKIKDGLQYFKDIFISNNGVIKYYSDNLNPIDIHNQATAVEFFAKWGEIDLATIIAEWTISKMQSKKGYFFYQINRFYTNKIPYIRWGQAHMYNALSELVLRINED